WPAARAEFERNAVRAPGALSKHRRVHQVLCHCLAAAQASVFYDVMSLWAEDVHIRELTRRSGASERSSFEHFKDAFELAHREERLGLWATFRESLACATHARDNVVRRAFEILQGHWSGIPPFPDVSYAEFLARAGSIARREGMLGWPHRVLLQPWFSQPSRRAPAVRDATQSSARGRNKRSPSRVAVCAPAAYAA
ncbi:MAG TPA: hypothetical protein VLN59_00625, partial [Burkholderiales bacterium]|nr:hypothetical protein [Burkholderiales bacterium]